MGVSDPPAEGLRPRVLFSMRRAAREGRRTTSPAGGAGNRRSVGHPARSEARKGRVSARPLFENSTACRKSVPSNTPCQGLLWFGFLWLIDIESASSRFSAAIKIIYGEFDPGSGRTLAACLTHASRTRPPLRRGVLVANG